MSTAIEPSQRSAARIAGISGLFAFAIVVAVNFGIFEKLIVAHDAAQTARNILANETLFRIGLVGNILYGIGVLVLLSALYVVLAPVNRLIALVAALCRLVYGGLWVISALNMLRALRLLDENVPYLQIFGADRLQALSRLDLAADFDAYYVGLPFFALAVTLCAWLLLRSRYIPRALAGFGLVASAWCVFCAFAFLVSPDFGKVVNPWLFDTPMGLFELIISAWLLVKGLPKSDVGVRVA
jgi:hypothetical protein